MRNRDLHPYSAAETRLFARTDRMAKDSANGSAKWFDIGQSIPHVSHLELSLAALRLMGHNRSLVESLTRSTEEPLRTSGLDLESL